MKSTRLNVFVMVAAVVGAIAMSSIPTEAQRKAGRQSSRQSGPRDWSHGRVIASRFGPDQGRSMTKDRRAAMKHFQLDQARYLRIDRAQDLRSPESDWFRTRLERLGSEQRAASSPHLDWSLRTGGFGSVIGSPAKFNFDITSSNCSDVIYFTVNQAGASATPNVIGITNPYDNCPGNPNNATPTVKFGIRLGTGTATSPVPSLDGKVLYVIESRVSGSGGVILHAINVDYITNPGNYNYTTQVWTNAHTLLATPIGATNNEQLFQITFAGVSNNLSSPYLDYENNQLFFGDSVGRIHRVINTNSSTASEDTAFLTVAARCGTVALQSPVFVNGQVITTSADGRLYRIDTTTGPPYTCIASAQAGAGTGAGVAGGLSAPVVDVSNSKIIVTTNNAFGFAVAGIGVFNLTFAANEGPTSSGLLGDPTTTAPNSPSFDNAFWTTNNGNVYAAGSPMGGANTYLVRTPYNGTLGTASGFAALARSGTASEVATSPVTEFLTASLLANPDFVFIGGGGGNHRFMNRIGSGFGGSEGTPTAMGGSFAVTGGVISGIIIDTRTALVTTALATANIYFGTIGIPSTTQSTIVQLAQQF